jgi:hypothetical protein
MTSFGRRVEWVHLALESIGAGSLRPSRLILWLDDPARSDLPTAGLRRLQKRGLEICLTPNYRPHKKYYPYVQSIAEHTCPLVTADDDLTYPTTWLETLMDNHAEDEYSDTAHRARVVMHECGHVLPYETWPEAKAGPSSPRHLATGNWGHVIVPTVLNALRNRADEFMRLAPDADDLWLHRVAVEQGASPKVTGTFTERDFLHLPDRETPLSSTNVERAGNDAQINASWTSEVVRRIVASETDDPAAHGNC